MPNHRGIEASIIEWSILEEAVLGCLSFSDVTFIRDFGPWKKGDQLDYITFNFRNCTVTVYSADGDPSVSCKIKLEVVTE